MNFLDDISDFINGKKDNIYLKSTSEHETKQIARELAKFLKSGDIVSLDGELGSGKTVFMKGIASYFNIEKDVSSPTFTIVNEYNGPSFPIFHFDVYRLEDAQKFEDTIGTDYFSLGLCIIEWGKIISDILPKNSIFIDITKNDENTRNIYIRRE